MLCRLSYPRSVRLGLIVVTQRPVARRRSDQAVMDLVEDALALRREIAHAGAAGDACLGDVTLEAVQLELQALELELGRRRFELAGTHDELGDEAGECLVAGREVRRRGPQASA